MNHLNVRCPSCAKLYLIDVTTIFSTSPHFQCLDCPTCFTFDFPPVSADNVKTRPVFATPPVEAVATRKCPKCGSSSPKTAEECYSCHVIFEKLEGLPLDSGLKTQPSLVRRWKELLNDYGDEEKHQDFLMACRDHDALEFARSKYEHIRRMQGTDEIADSMLARIGALRTVAEETKPAPAETKDGRFARWKTAALLSPFAISGLLILWGFTHVAQRNMVGAGIAAGLLSYGIFAGMKSRRV